MISEWPERKLSVKPSEIVGRCRFCGQEPIFIQLNAGGKVTTAWNVDRSRHICDGVKALKLRHKIIKAKKLISKSEAKDA